MVCVLVLSLRQYFYGVQKLLKHIRRQKRKGASKLMKVYPCVLQTHQNNSYEKSHRTHKPTCMERKPSLQSRCNDMVADGEGRKMEGERVDLSRWSCCGPAANNLNIYFLYLGQNFANSYTGEQLYTHEWSHSIQDTKSLPND